jgi:pilus assembly protein Flp/PilA
MSKLQSAVNRFMQDEEGASMAEYALLLGVIAVALIAVIATFRNEIAGVFNRTGNTLKTVNP